MVGGSSRGGCPMGSCLCIVRAFGWSATRIFRHSTSLSILRCFGLGWFFGFGWPCTLICSFRRIKRGQFAWCCLARSNHCSREWRECRQFESYGVFVFLWVCARQLSRHLVIICHICCFSCGDWLFCRCSDYGLKPPKCHLKLRYSSCWAHHLHSFYGAMGSRLSWGSIWRDSMPQYRSSNTYFWFLWLFPPRYHQSEDYNMLSTD